MRQEDLVLNIFLQKGYKYAFSAPFPSQPLWTVLKGSY
ncbi:hypothetical protein BMWSH_0970 [Priestia megaterium WSH-002]|uniref:Uncharacterized protein n=1 Tax=Priestia megaterium (strain WSH-002) TaxID=1006007 RepID=A0A8D3WYL4_PRIMW|nr:hypothetical protein BMWSH_0970 [Priestia megaterium WSH-002]